MGSGPHHPAVIKLSIPEAHILHWCSIGSYSYNVSYYQQKLELGLLAPSLGS